MENPRQCGEYQIWRSAKKIETGIFAMLTHLLWTFNFHFGTFAASHIPSSHLLKGAQLIKPDGGGEDWVGERQRHPSPLNGQ
jgi:hypothetical protein